MDLLIWITLFCAGLLLGYVLRKYVEKRWPDTARALDVVAKAYGEQAELYVKRARTRLGSGS